MRTRQAADQGYRIERRTWKSNGVLKESYRLFWHTDDSIASGRRRVCSQQGFRTRDDARRYFFNKVVPCLRAGFSSPEDQAAHERRVKAEAEAKAPTLAKLVDAHLEASRVNMKSGSLGTKKSTLGTAVAFLSGTDRKIGEITRQDVERWLNSPARGHAPAGDTKIGRFRSLNMVFEEAVADGFIEVNPCSGIKLPRPSAGRMRPLSVDEAGRFLKACLQIETRHDAETAPWFICAMAAFALYTGARADEVMHAHWSDFDMESAHVTIQPLPHLNWTTKNGKARVIQVQECLIRILRRYDEDRRVRLAVADTRLAELRAWAGREETGAQMAKPEILARYKRPPSMKVLIAKADGVVAALRRQIASPLIFPNPAGMIMTELPKGLERALVDSGLKAEGIVFHSLRETFGTSLAKARVDLLSLKMLMGHKDIETTMRYIAYNPDYAAGFGVKMPEFISDAELAKAVAETEDAQSVRPLSTNDSQIAPSFGDHTATKVNAAMSEFDVELTQTS